ncbi:MarR family winged helix-turn-helix transcriptional regulator [Crossiella sp. CA198]|uniref:MarR family winged helix-turn-helix transcriptional regulator n=1 Tax=Crossiella sp. CA198 TaxID=3455607 RepID=UPI003F8D22EE
MGIDGLADADGILAAWRQERPDLEVSSLGPFIRMLQVTQLVSAAVERVFLEHGLRRGEFDVLTSLRRSGAPFTLTPSELAGLLMLSRAGMTNRLDRLEAAGYVERRLDPADRRSFLIALTPRGREVIDEAFTAHIANLHRLTASVSAEQRGQLDVMMRALLADLRATGGCQSSGLP